MAVVKGFVTHIIYRNQENGYTVMEIENKSGTFTLVGSLPYINEGETIEAEGNFVSHAVYGEQLAVEKYQIAEPEDLESIERYLGSGAISGIGPSLASRIVKKFKADTLRIMDEEPERLAEVKGISEQGASRIAAQVMEKRELRQAMIFLQQYGIGLNLAVKIYERYGPEMYKLIQTNPYQIADDIPGVGFRTADQIAAKVGAFADSDYRIRSGIYYTLTQAASAGHVYLPQDVLLSNSARLLGIPEEELEQQVMNLAMDKRLVLKERDGEVIVYSAMYYYMEAGIAAMLKLLDITFPVDEEKNRKWLEKSEKDMNLVLDQGQRLAVLDSIQRGLTVITGGPGTGKTTTINMLLKYFEERDMVIELAAPTGRAAKRMTEATGHEARTIHRMLEFSGSPGENHEDDAIKFERNESNPLEADVIVIDEMSMVDIHLMYALLKAVVPGTRLILVGDANQLPSVGPGNILRDILKSEAFHNVYLTKIFRQAEASDIVVNAHKIHQGEKIDASKKSRDFLFVKRYEVQSILGAVITLVKDKLPAYVKADIHEIQVMTPMRKGVLGVENLNKVLQQYLNPPDDGKKEKQFPRSLFRQGDKVMQIKNNYQLEWKAPGSFGDSGDHGTGIFNGDIGIVQDINFFSEELVVLFDEERLVHYKFSEVGELELAYAITVHKSQGSEYPAVVIPILTGPRMLMNRNLIYTAVTRAKNCVCIVGPVEAFQEMVDNEEEQKRYSALDVQIKELFELQGMQEMTLDF